MFLFLYTHITGSPDCLTVNTTVTTSSSTVSIKNSQMAWLPEWYCVQVIFYNESIAIVTYNSTLKHTTSFEVTPLEPDTVYNISVTPCNMAGCNESCDVHSVQTDSDTSNVGGDLSMTFRERGKQTIPQVNGLATNVRIV